MYVYKCDLIFLIGERRNQLFDLHSQCVYLTMFCIQHFEKICQNLIGMNVIYVTCVDGFENTGCCLHLS